MISIKITLLNEQGTNDMVKLWNENFDIPYYVNEKILQQKIFKDKDTFGESSFLVHIDSQLVGFIVSKLNRNGLPGQDDCGWISTLVVDEKFRNQGIGSELYNKAEEKLYQEGINKIILGGEFDNFFSGIPQPTAQSVSFFENRGFTINEDEHYDLMGDISKSKLYNANVKINRSNQYNTREMRREDLDKLNEFFDKTFPGRWKQETVTYIENGGDLKNVILLWDSGQIEGFCRIYISKGKSDLDFIRGEGWGSLGPIGISENIRGKGLGNRILYDSLRFLQARGARNVFIDWTILKDYYGQFGFKPMRTYRGAYKLAK